MIVVMVIIRVMIIATINSNIFQFINVMKSLRLVTQDLFDISIRNLKKTQMIVLITRNIHVYIYIYISAETKVLSYIMLFICSSFYNINCHKKRKFNEKMNLLVCDSGN